MTEKNKIETRLEALGNELRGQESVVGDVMSRINAMPPVTRGESQARGAIVWRFIMNRYTKIAAAAAVFAIAAIVTFMAMEKATPMAYAVEQTIEAIQNIRFVHITDREVGKVEPMNIWMEYNENTEPVRIRLSMPEWKNPQDGPKEAVWEGNIAQVYMPKKKVFVVVGEKRILREMREIAVGLDAGSLFKIMVEQEKSGQRTVQITMPSKDGEPIIVTSTGKSVVKKFYIDSTTKLLTTMETYAVDDNGNEKLQYRMECDYVRPQGDIFSLEVPEGTMKVDMVNTVVGIPQGDMTDTQIATEVVRQFWQALIDGDYQKAGGIYSGVPGERLKTAFGQTKITRILSADEPTADTARAGDYNVSCTVEFQTGGKVEQKTFKVFVRKGDDQAHPNNWVISGGI
jgi:hypothetical protein